MCHLRRWDGARSLPAMRTLFSYERMYACCAAATALPHQSCACHTGRMTVAVAPSAMILSTTRRASENGGKIQRLSSPPQWAEKASTPSQPGVRIREKKRVQRVLTADANMSIVGPPHSWSSRALIASHIR